MKQFERLKRLHDYLVNSGLEYIQEEFDSIYKLNDNAFLMLTHTVFKNDFTELDDEDWEKCIYSRKYWDEKRLILYNAKNYDSIVLLTIEKNGEVSLEF